MSKKIITFINDQEVELFWGATLKNALLKVNEKYYRLVINNQAEIRDHEGNHVGLTGSIDRNFKYYIVQKNPKKSELDFSKE